MHIAMHPVFLTPMRFTHNFLCLLFVGQYTEMQVFFGKVLNLFVFFIGKVYICRVKFIQYYPEQRGRSHKSYEIDKTDGIRP